VRAKTKPLLFPAPSRGYVKQEKKKKKKEKKNKKKKKKKLQYGQCRQDSLSGKGRKYLQKNACWVFTIGLSGGEDWKSGRAGPVAKNRNTNRGKEEKKRQRSAEINLCGGGCGGQEERVRLDKKKKNRR